MRNVSHLVDTAARSRVLVLGSLPPGGRDLDLLVRTADREAIAARLPQEGFLNRGNDWVLFEGCSAFVVELMPAEAYRVPEPQLSALFAEALPIDGLERLVRPAPHHALLILARLGMTEKRQARLDAALAEDPAALAKAGQLAASWDVDLATLRLRRKVTRRPRRRTVVALSGLDGSGKSSQTAELRETLERLGKHADVVWLPLAANPAVWKVSLLSRRALRAARWLPGLNRVNRRIEAGESFFATPGQTRRPSLMTRAWVTYVAFANALTHRRLARRADVVVFDRYVLDSAVRLRYMWGGRFRLAVALLRVVSPKPVLAFLLEVPGDVAFARKQDQWSPDDLRRQAELYRKEADRLGVACLDGTRPKEEICAEIAEAVWRRLG